jgi:hypothetical protein
MGPTEQVSLHHVTPGVREEAQLLGLFDALCHDL